MRLVVLATFVLSSACAPIKVDPDPTRAAVQINSGIDRLASVENAVVVNLVRLRGEPARSIEPPLRLVLDSLPLRGVAKGNPIVVAPGRYVWQPSPTVDAGRPAAADVFFIRALAAAGFASGGDADAGYRVVLDEIAARDDEPPDAFFSRLQERLVGCVLSSLRVQWGIVARPPGDPHLASSLRRSVLATPPYRGVEYSRAQPTLLFRMPLTAGQPCDEAPTWEAYGEPFTAYLAAENELIKSPPSLQRYRRADNPEHLPGQISVELPLRAAGDWRDEYVPLGTNVTDLERLARRRIAFVDRLDIWFPTAVLGQEERKRAVRKGRFRIAFVDGGVLPKVELPSTIKPEILLLPGDVVRFERGGAEFFAR